MHRVLGPFGCCGPTKSPPRGFPLGLSGVCGFTGHPIYWKADMESLNLRTGVAR